MSSYTRTAQGGAIDRTKRLKFTFDGGTYEGFAGDTVASALLANGIRIVGRSFKYHRPRGVFSAGPEEPNAILDLRHGTRHDPNARATLEPLADGVVLRSIHASGTADRDRLAFLDGFARFIPAAFYYKTFMWPKWSAYEHRIRSLAGLGRVDAAGRAASAAHRHAQADICVVGAGPSGLTAALAASRDGKRVILAEEQPELGGSLRHRETMIDGMPGDAWVSGAEQSLRGRGVEVLRRSIAVSLYDHNVRALVQKGVPESANDERIWLVRAGRIIVATGAIERPLLFANNDRPGVMLADAALAYLCRYAVKLGNRAVVATSNDSAYEVALALRRADSAVHLVDSRPEVEIDPTLSASVRGAGIDVLTAATIDAVIGSRGVEAVTLSNGKTIPADLVAQSGGWTPSLHLYCHAKGKPQWDSLAGSYRPGAPVPDVDVVGAAAGIWDLDAMLQHATVAAGGEVREAPRSTIRVKQWTAPSPLPRGSTKRIWVDLQNDVTTSDIELAVRENFSAIEHLKRYTTIGMGTDQGKTSNVNALTFLAANASRDIAALGTTTFRPPYVPVSMATIAGPERGQLQAPIRRLPTENMHRQEGAYFRDYGGVLRPAWYGGDEAGIAAECVSARNHAVVFDASSLGKIEVIGPQAAALLDFVYYTPMSSLAVSRARYGLTLSEAGIVADDGVVLRLAANHFVVSCSSSHVAFMAGQLEAWRQDRFDLAQVFVHDATSHWATIAVSGPDSKRIVAGLELGIDLDDSAFPHMSVAEGTFGGRPARIARVSFTGERGYEISVPAKFGAQLWQCVRDAGAAPLGIEALGVLRAEKGYIYVGQDTDGETMPHDLGMAGPRSKRQDSFIGDRSLFTPAAGKLTRKKLVGILAEGNTPIPVGANAIEIIGGRRRGIGYVTSSYVSVHFSHPIALGLIEGGLERGGAIDLEHLGQRYKARIVPPCFFDPKGARLNA
ncbi:MAG TPA: 2Fe-2S iron-sulfur cluster-binding protein [Dongiaceae bacterium]|jgi:sarcosine oxidase subunit alpha|nr:2Fe-2S iron-sulfur cluster-binding protein [Dongiaceae bacterium]